jgi:MoaA/NifB/PqqE/SkfB family radical SAM enzyme
MNYPTDSIIRGLANYIDRNPVKNLNNILKFLKSTGLYRIQEGSTSLIYEVLNNHENPWYRFLKNDYHDLNKKTRRNLIGNFLLRAGLFAKPKRKKLRETLQQQIPFAVLMDPTSACNLECLGCWANDYAKTDSLSFDLMDRIIREGKELAAYVYLFSGGEPLIRKKEIIRLCEKHPDCFFLAFTNGTLIDEEFAAEVARVGNFVPAFSIEGFEEMTDFRRGMGTYNKVIQAMDLMHSYGNMFGFSAAYHRLNSEVIVSDEFIDLMLEKGANFGWYFTYMPVGSDAHPELIVTPEQREYMYHTLRAARKKRPMFLLDFWNDGEYINGCIAAGRQYLHINARGDVEPCAFIHYSNVNIRDSSLVEALRQPIFEEYRKRQPFNHNQLRPCPCLDNPDKLRSIVNASKARSTQKYDNESVEQLTAKCEEHACGWAPVAHSLNHASADELQKRASKIKTKHAQKHESKVKV